MSTLSELLVQLPPDAVSREPQDLRERAHDWWPLGLLHEARGDEMPLPEAVLLPTSTEQVARILAWANTHGVAVVPRGGGTGVCGGVMPPAGAVVLDLTRMNRVLALDSESQVVEVQAGIRGEHLEAELNGHGLALGHYPQSFPLSTVGGWIAATSAGQISPAYGFVEDHVLGATAVLASGDVLRLRPVPRSAAGPNLRTLLIGSEGTLAVITEATLACVPLSPGFAWSAFRHPSFTDCLATGRAVLRSGAGAWINRGWDEIDARAAFAELGHDRGGVTVVGFGQEVPGLEARQRAVASIAAAHSGSELPADYGAHWWKHRLAAIDTFQQVMGHARSLGDGVILDTIEVAGLWSDLPLLYEGMRAALSAYAAQVRCHFSHVYSAGACLYFTFVIRSTSDEDAEAQYRQLWDRATDACFAAGGTITHHHGIGRLKVPYLARELGSTGVETLRRIKDALDPNGILNPGALLAQK